MPAGRIQAVGLIGVLDIISENILDMAEGAEEIFVTAVEIHAEATVREIPEEILTAVLAEVRTVLHGILTALHEAEALDRVR